MKDNYKKDTESMKSYWESLTCKKKKNPKKDITKRYQSRYLQNSTNGAGNRVKEKVISVCSPAQSQERKL